MLSKLRHFTRDYARDLANLRSRVDVRPALEAMGVPEAPVSPVVGGTLGVGFITTINGRRQFLKSFASSEGKQNLEKEIRILAHLYGDRLAIRRIEVPEENAPTRIWLVMDALEPPKEPLRPSEALALVDDYRARLVSLPASCLNTDDTLGVLIGDAFHGLTDLASRGEIGSSMADELHSRLSNLAQQWRTMPASVSHGDLGPRNIMIGSDRLVAIDWEDAFLAVEGYDYLYWLTFFENRRYYGAHVLGRTSLGLQAEVTLLAMILLLKSHLSLRANTYAGNQLTIEQRIGEVLALS